MIVYAYRRPDLKLKNHALGVPLNRSISYIKNNESESRMNWGTETRFEHPGRQNLVIKTARMPRQEI
jgi:hypothetical protein